MVFFRGIAPDLKLANGASSGSTGVKNQRPRNLSNKLSFAPWNPNAPAGTRFAKLRPGVFRTRLTRPALLVRPFEGREKIPREWAITILWQGGAARLF